MSNIEQTLSIIKPDAVERNLQEQIKSEFKKNGFEIFLNTASEDELKKVEGMKSDLIENLIGCILNKTMPEVTHQDIFKSMNVSLCIEESIEKGCPIRIE